MLGVHLVGAAAAEADHVVPDDLFLDEAGGADVVVAVGVAEALARLQGEEVLADGAVGWGVAHFVGGR